MSIAQPNATDYLSSPDHSALHRIFAADVAAPVESIQILSSGVVGILSGLTPVASDGAALGTTALMFSDLFLASGGVINFNNGNMTITHSAGVLTVSAGTFAVGTLTATTINGTYISLGTNALSGNLAIGASALHGANSGTGLNVAVGLETLYTNTSGARNTAVGNEGLYTNLSGNDNTGVGYFNSVSNSTGSGNTALGSYAGYQATGSNGVYLGFMAGAHETTGSAFYLDAFDRSTTAGDKAGALLYGKFNATPASQTLQINASTTVLTTLQACSVTVLDTDITGFSGYPALVGVAANASNFTAGLVGNGNTADGSILAFYKTRSTATDANTIVQNGDCIFQINGYGANGTAYNNGGGIQMHVDGTPGVNDMPTRLTFWTTPDGSGTTAERMRIASTGVVTIANLAGSGSRAVNADANGVLSAASDERMKTNFQDLTGEVDVIGLLKDPHIKAVFYNWKDTETKGSQRELGMTYQMFKDIIPEIAGLEGTGDDQHGYLDYQKLTVVLWEQNRQLLKRIEVLESRDSLDLI